MTTQIGGLGGSSAAWWSTTNRQRNERTQAFPYDTETIERRKKDPALDRAMYDAELAAVTGEQSKLEMLARKVARGEKLNPDEERLMLEKNPEMLKKAIEAREEAKRLKARLEAARTPAEASAILAQSASSAAAGKNDPLGAALKAEAAQAVQARGVTHRDDNSRLKLLADDAIAARLRPRAPETSQRVDLDA